MNDDPRPTFIKFLKKAATVTVIVLAWGIVGLIVLVGLVFGACFLYATHFRR